MSMEPDEVMSMGSDVRDFTLLTPAPLLPSLSAAGGGCGMSVNGGHWTDLHPTLPYSPVSYPSLMRQELGWGTEPLEDPHYGLGAFTVHFSGQFTGTGPYGVGATGEQTAGQPRTFPSGTYLSSCMDSPSGAWNQGDCGSHCLFFFFFFSSVEQQYAAPPSSPPPPMYGCHNLPDSCPNSQALLLRNYNRDNMHQMASQLECVTRQINTVTASMKNNNHNCSYDSEPTATPPPVLLSAEYHIHTHSVFREVQDVRRVPGTATPVTKSESIDKRPFSCTYPGCSKRYFKMSHLLTHGHKHTGSGG
uniref:WT1 transcription factor b n=1 Tax=Cynoglossus semilaevis TaxID=244447 RepID=A0A3P8W7E1_CYNSE